MAEKAEHNPSGDNTTTPGVEFSTPPTERNSMPPFHDSSNVETPRIQEPATQDPFREEESKEKEKQNYPGDSDGSLKHDDSVEQGDDGFDRRASKDLCATEDDLREARDLASRMTLDRTSKLLTQVMDVHGGDPNFPNETRNRIRQFLSMGEEELAKAEHDQLVEEMKLETALITNNSPYAEVRATISNGDDPTLPVGTIRMWTIGTFFCILLTFVNQLFVIRMPTIGISALVCQLLTYPIGKAWAAYLPRGEMKVPFTKRTICLNPGPFNKKEHLLIAIMAGIASGSSGTSNTVIDLFFVQFLPSYYNQEYAKGFGYQLTNILATNFMGYGLAGILRRFVVYPAYCVWPLNLVYFALNTALHDTEDLPVRGLFNKTYSITRFKFFMLAGAGMFVWYWFPNYIFPALQLFSWMTWIAPKNINLNVLAGINNGLSLINPLTSFDWNIISFAADPLVVPSFTIFNLAAGMWIGGWAIMGVYYTNKWETSHIPINTNIIVDHFGDPYNVSLVVDKDLQYNEEKYLAYSAAYSSAGQIVHFFGYFAMYSAAVTHVAFYHRKEMMLGLKGFWKEVRHPMKSARARKEGPADDEYCDVHMRLMRAYPEVSELWYLLILVISIGLGAVGIACWPTHVSPAVPLFGIALCIVFIIPIGVITAVTGFDIPLTVIAQFIGGVIADGNAMTLNFFKVYGFIVASHAVSFAGDLKIAHYAKIPPWFTFTAQLWGSLLGSIVTTGVLQIQQNIKNVCTPLAPNKFTCPVVGTMFSASVTWGTVGPVRMFGAGGQYTWLLAGFPAGALFVIAVHLLRMWKPKNGFLAKTHIVVFFCGVVQWAPFSFGYMWMSVPIAAFSWNYIRPRYLAFWAKYNYITAAAFECGIALSAILIMFSVQWEQTTFPKWWGTEVVATGCEAVACVLKPLGKIDGKPARFTPWWHGQPAPGKIGQPYALSNVTAIYGSGGQ